MAMMAVCLALLAVSGICYGVQSAQKLPLRNFIKLSWLRFAGHTFSLV
jgi:hypothetical protein